MTYLHSLLTTEDFRGSVARRPLIDHSQPPVELQMILYEFKRFV